MFVKPDNWTPQGVDALEPAALRAVFHNSGNLSVVASAGAGKTEFLAQKADYLLSTGICRAPNRILAISFKSDAARNLKNRVRERCGPELAFRFDSMTFDAFSKGLIDRFGALIPAPYTPSTDYQIVFPTFRDWGDFLKRKGFHDLQGKTLEKAVARCALPISKLNPKNLRWKEVLELYWQDAYLNPEETRLSFPMINRLTSFVLQTDPRLAAGIRATYPFVFLDEFQDTTYGQYELLKILFEGQDVRLTAVGDNKQRIMVWAGAMPNAFKTLETDFKASKETLVSNWRSHTDLVKIQHAIAITLEEDVPKPEAKRVRDVQGDISAIWTYSNSNDECSGVAAWVGAAIAAGEMEPEDCAILVRNQPWKLENELSPELEEHGVILRNIARKAKHSDILIQDILTEELTYALMPLLRLAVRDKSPDDWHSMIQVLSDLKGVAPENEIQHDSLQAELGAFVSDLRTRLGLSPPSKKACAKITKKMLEFVGEDRLRRSVPAYGRDRDYKRICTGFYALLCESVENQTDWASVVKRFDGEGQVPLMSVHRSKGLEYHTVIFFGLDKKTWWSFEPDDSEEMRAFFVAFTRAKQRVFFTSCAGRGIPLSYIDDLVGSVGVARTPGPES